MLFSTHAGQAKRALPRPLHDSMEADNKLTRILPFSEFVITVVSHTKIIALQLFNIFFPLAFHFELLEYITEEAFFPL